MKTMEPKKPKKPRMTRDQKMLKKAGVKSYEELNLPPGMIPKAQDGKIIKSKKVRTANMNTFGPSTASVSKTKKDGSTVTKSVNTNQGYVPSASKTKSITDSQGNTTSSTKDMSWNKAVKKQYRMAKKVGRNPNDELTINKTGGMVNSNSKVSALKSAGSKGVKSGVNPKAAASKRATGKTGGTSTAPKGAVPKAKYGMVMRKK
jgi:hypothetical protein